MRRDLVYVNVSNGGWSLVVLVEIHCMQDEDVDSGNAMVH